MLATYDAPIECIGGPLDGESVALPRGRATLAHRTSDGTWHEYRLAPDDSEMLLRYVGPVA